MMLFSGYISIEFVVCFTTFFLILFYFHFPAYAYFLSFNIYYEAAAARLSFIFYASHII